MRKFGISIKIITPIKKDNLTFLDKAKEYGFGYWIGLVLARIKNGLILVT